MENSYRARVIPGKKGWVYCSRCPFRSFRSNRAVKAHIRTAHGATNRFWEHRHKVKTGDERFRLVAPAGEGIASGGTSHGSIRRRLAVQLAPVHVPLPIGSVVAAFPTSVFDAQKGMSLRDYLAASALKGMLSNSMKTGTLRDAAIDAYTAADEMLEARKVVRA